ncbi:hypothetical protein LguiA_027081 [Lonicera macranthoides]
MLCSILGRKNAIAHETLEPIKCALSSYFTVQQHQLLMMFSTHESSQNTLAAIDVSANRCSHQCRDWFFC